MKNHVWSLYYRLYINGKLRPGWYIAPVQDDLNLLILRMFIGTSRLTQPVYKWNVFSIQRRMPFEPILMQTSFCLFISIAIFESGCIHNDRMFFCFCFLSIAIFESGCIYKDRLFFFCFFFIGALIFWKADITVKVWTQVQQMNRDLCSLTRVL